MIILFFILFLIVFVCLVDKDLQKCKRSMEKKYKKCMKKYKELEKRQFITEIDVGDILEELEVSSCYENEEKCKQ